MSACVILIQYSKKRYSTMPVPVKYKCKKCGGENGIANSKCLNCELEEYLRMKLGAKNIPNNIFPKKKYLNEGNGIRHQTQSYKNVDICTVI